MAGLSSLARCSRSRRVFLFSIAHSHAQKRMAAIVKNRNGVEVIAKFVALQVNGNNSATKKEMKNGCHRFVHACL